jgi:hypothetical protein
MDRQIIAARIAWRRRQIILIEDRLVSACERAAGHGRPGRRPPEDRGEWNRSTWRRYLREAAAQEQKLGPRLRRLHLEIAQLERLLALPLVDGVGLHFRYRDIQPREPARAKMARDPGRAVYSIVPGVAQSTAQ